MNTSCKKTGVIFNEQRFSLHDGPGIRTTVFFKGCPLKCRWCHNPESWKSEAELFYHAKTCVGCGACVGACSTGAHVIADGGHALDRSKCVTCLKCADACPTGALERVGRLASAEEIMATVMRDEDFYGAGGGLTVSGGEPFMQVDFLVEILTLAKQKGLHTCVETSGATPLDNLLRAEPYVDLFLYDVKLIPGEKHKQYIGVDGVMLHENLKALDKSGAKIVLRCPIIPGVNDDKEHFKYISSLAGQLENLVEINLQPYHTTGLAKATDIGKTDSFTVEGFDARVFKTRIEKELLPIISTNVKVKIN